MKNDIYLTLEKDDLEIHEDLEFGDEPRYMTAYFETYFDADKKFGLNTSVDDSAWVNLYAKYNPFENILLVDYVISTDESSIVRTYQPTEAETKMMTRLIDEVCVKQMGVLCRDALIRDFFNEADEISLVCEKVSDNEYQIRNTWGDFVVCKEDETGKLKNHIGHKIELAAYNRGNGECDYAIECADCCEVLYSPETVDETMDMGMDISM